jgi:hypothetical protein
VYRGKNWQLCQNWQPFGNPEKQKSPQTKGLQAFLGYPDPEQNHKNKRNQEKQKPPKIRGFERCDFLLFILICLYFVKIGNFFGNPDWQPRVFLLYLQPETKI